MLMQTFTKTIAPKLQQDLGQKNPLTVPKVTKIVLNYRVKEARESQEALNQAMEELAAIAGQKPVVTKAKKAISSFKLRQNDPLALKVTLRHHRMYDFMEKFFFFSFATFARF
jgi:large subunit ribosomal protein L5